MLALAVTSMACSNEIDTSSTQAPAPASTGDEDASDEPDARRIGCEFGPFFAPSTLDTAPVLVEDSNVSDIAAAMATFLDTGEGAFWPQDGWRVLRSDHSLQRRHPETLKLVRPTPTSG